MSHGHSETGNSAYDHFSNDHSFDGTMVDYQPPESRSQSPDTMHDNNDDGGVLLPKHEEDVSTVVASPTVSEATVGTEPFPEYSEQAETETGTERPLTPRPPPRAPQKPYDAVASIQGLIDVQNAKHNDMQARLNDTTQELTGSDPNAIVQRHIKLLHDYNEIKDVGMGLFGLIADRRGVRVKDVFEEFGVSEDD